MKLNKKSLFISFLIGATFVSLFATVQFILILGVIKLEGYIVPIIVGGVSGVLISVRVQKNYFYKRKLEEKTERLELILTGTELGMWDWVPSTGEVNFDNQWCKLLGYNHSELAPNINSLKNKIHKKDLQSWLDNTQAHINGETSFYENIQRMKHKNGDWIYILDRGKITTEKSDETSLKFRGIYTDITNLKNIEKDLERSNNKLFKLSYTDGLTNIKNRRAFEEHFEKQWSHWERKKIQFSILFIDIDYFKQFNDTYGHIKGDECLISLAKKLEYGVFRKNDMVARYGGEEFIILLTDSDLESSLVKAEQIRRSVECLNIPHKGSSCSEIVTISIGVASCKNNEKNDILINADKGLYIAKNNGRNQTHAIMKSSMSLVTKKKVGM